MEEVSPAYSTQITPVCFTSGPYPEVQIEPCGKRKVLVESVVGCRVFFSAFCRHCDLVCFTSTVRLCP